jgi:hypothetical protein
VKAAKVENTNTQKKKPKRKLKKNTKYTLKPIDNQTTKRKIGPHLVLLGNAKVNNSSAIKGWRKLPNQNSKRF